MRPVSWQKSSYSSEGSACLEVAAPGTPGGAVWLRESDDPGTVLRTTPARLRALLDAVRQDDAR